MLEALRSAVQTWECDQMGHLNVRFYFQRADDALAMLAARLGLPPAELRERGLTFAARDQHVRFLREMRAGTPFSGRIGVVAVGEEAMTTVVELRHEVHGVPAATITTELQLADARTRAPRPLPDAVLRAARELGCEPPPHAAPRGLSPHPPGPEPTLQHADAIGMYPGFLGPIPAELCDPSGHLTPAGHMACVSDGVPYYMIKTRPPSPRGIGGAALEYRYVYRRPARQGDLLAVRTGVRAVHNKAFELCHFIFDAVTGQCVATSEAVVVSFDLKARKAAELRPDDRASLESMIVDGLQA